MRGNSMPSFSRGAPGFARAGDVFEGEISPEELFNMFFGGGGFGGAGGGFGGGPSKPDTFLYALCLLTSV